MDFDLKDNPKEHRHTMVKTKKKKTASKVKRAAASKSSSATTLSIGGKELEISGDQLQMILSVLSGAKVEESASTSKESPSKKEKKMESAQVITRTPETPVKKRTPGVANIDIPKRIKAINTAKVTQPGGYNRLRYQLMFLEEKLLKKRVMDEKRLVKALKAFKDEPTQEARDFIGRVLQLFVNKGKLNEDTEAEVKAFRKRAL